MRLLRTATEDTSALISFHNAVLDNEACVVEISTEAAFRVLYLAILDSKGVPPVDFIVQVGHFQIVPLVLAQLIAVQKDGRAG